MRTVTLWSEREGDARYRRLALWSGSTFEMRRGFHGIGSVTGTAAIERVSKESVRRGGMVVRRGRGSETKTLIKKKKKEGENGGFGWCGLVDHRYQGMGCWW